MASPRSIPPIENPAIENPDPSKGRPGPGPLPTRRQRRLSRRRRARLARTGVVTGCLVVAALALVLVRSSSGSGPTSPRTAAGTPARGTEARSRAGTLPAATSAPTTTAPPTTTTTTAPPTTTTTDAGALPQTSAFPTTSSAQFQSEMAALWQGVVTGSVPAAMAAFFPEDAYVQVKSGGGNQSDWQNRLVAEYGLDLQAVHGLLGPAGASAQLVSVNVPTEYGHWVPPGACENVVGYFEVPNARVVYQVGGQEQSFGIASMISWRGEWYVVHLGAVSRDGSGGQVDDPEPGAGTSADTATC